MRNWKCMIAVLPPLHIKGVCCIGIEFGYMRTHLVEKLFSLLEGHMWNLESGLADLKDAFVVISKSIIEVSVISPSVLRLAMLS